MKLIRPLRLALLVSVLALAAVFAAAACGDDDDDDDTNGPTPTEAPDDNGDNGDNGNGGEVTFDVSMGDNFFDPNEFTVEEGATITFNITNDGAAIHNMRIAGADNEYNTDDDAVSDPELMTGGQEGTLVWTAPNESGVYDFLCDFHPTDMVGTITVE